jgi:hypothetical protein
MGEVKPPLSIEDVENINSPEELFETMKTMVPYSRPGFTVAEIHGDLSTALNTSHIQLLVNDDDYGQLIVTIASTDPLRFRVDPQNKIGIADMNQIKEDLEIDLFDHRHQESLVLLYLIRKFSELSKNKPAEIKRSKGVRGAFQKLFGKSK